jgi:hypothetical protein
LSVAADEHLSINKEAMAGPWPKPEALHNALSREQARQRMEERSSNDVLLDAEGIALKDLSHQRSHVETPALQTKIKPSTNAEHKGLRRGTRDELTNRERKDTLTMGRLYEKMGKLSIIPRYIVYILPLGMLIAVPLVLGAVMPKLELGVLTNLFGTCLIYARE